ncbi:MAG TPA: RNA methyltransferase [Paracoccaceae bacterium]|nr:RNA methyltransferase [Paracoccaceae bacterium]
MTEIPKPAVVLVQPQMGENIGAAARAMRNFALEEMRLVAPRDGWPNPRAEAMASGAGVVLEAATLHDDTAGAVADLTHVYATTARPREMIKPVMTPEAAVADARARLARGERVGFLFGPERSGLANEDVLLAHTVVTVPANPQFPSLNLAQCVLLTSYEWGRQSSEAPLERFDPGPAGPATRRMVLHLLDRLEGELDDTGFFHPPEKRPAMSTNLRNLFLRAPLTDAEVRTLHGVVRALAEKRRRAP